MERTESGTTEKGPKTSEAAKKTVKAIGKLERSSDITDKDVLSVMIPKLFGIKEPGAWAYRKKFSKEHRDRLAKMSGVSLGEYNKDTGKYNGDIAKKILANNILPLQDYNEALDGFSTKKQERIHALIAAKTFTSEQVERYISNLNSKQIEALEKQFPDAGTFVSFLEREIGLVATESDNMKKTQDNKLGISSKTSEQIANMKQIETLQKRIDTFMAQSPALAKKLSLDATTKKFGNEETEKGYQAYVAKYKKDNPEAYEKLMSSEKGSKETAEETLRALYQLEQIRSSDEYAKLTKEQKQEFNMIVQDFYTYSISLGMDPASFGLGVLYSQVLEYFNEKSKGNDTYAALLTGVSSNDAIITYFKDNKLEKLVEKDKKDKEYYKKLLIWYPDFDKDLSSTDQKTLSSYIDYFTDDLKIDKDKTKDLTPAEQKSLENIGKKLGAATGLGEEGLIAKTNEIVKATAIDNCISMLQEYMDIDVTATENIKEKFVLADKDAKGTEMVSKDKENNLVVNITGKMNDTDLNLSYNLGTGKVYCQKALNKTKDSNQSSLFVNDTLQENNQIPLIALPTLGNFTDAAKPENMDYKALVTQSASLDAYGTNVRTKLQGSVKLDAQRDMRIAKDMLKDTVLKNSNMQKIFALLGRPADATKEISKEQSPQAHAFYTYLYNSLAASPDQLQQFREDLIFLETMRNTTLTKDITTIASETATANPEHFVMQAILNQKNIPQTNTNRSDQTPEISMMSFFSCFEKKDGSIPVIDMAMFNDYIETSKLGDSTSGIGKWKKNEKFTKLTNDMQTSVGQHQATADLDAQLKNLS